MHRAKGDRLVRASGLPVRQCLQLPLLVPFQSILDKVSELHRMKHPVDQMKQCIISHQFRTQFTIRPNKKICVSVVQVTS